MENIDIIINARDFAIANHRRINQLYDGLPYYIHLLEVVEFANKFSYLLKDGDIVSVIAAAWNHDVIEDTGLAYIKVKSVLGERVASLVCNLSTNIYGKNRDERADDDYYRRVASDDLSIYIKLADRIANMYHSYNYGNPKMFKMYKKELPHFKEKLYNGMYDDMWDFLENIENFKVYENVLYPDVEKFDAVSVYKIHLPKPIPYIIFREIYSKGVIPKSKLIKNKYYKGKCRNATVALWNGYEFVYMRNKFGETYVETIKHPEDDDNYDLFIPIEEESNPEEHEQIKY